MRSLYSVDSEGLGGQPIKRFFRLIASERKDVALIYVYAVFAGIINLSLPLGVQAIINQIMGGQVSSSWVLLVVLVIIGVLFAGFIQILQLTITETLQQRIFARAAFEFAFRIPRLKVESLLKFYPPELMNRFFDILSVQKGLSKILIDFSTSILQILFGIILLAFYHPFFVFFGLSMIFLLFLVFRFTGPRGLATSIKESKYKYEVAHWLEEVARAMGIFKMAGYTEMPLDRTDYLTSNYINARRSHFKVLLFQYASMIGFKTIVTAGLLILGSLLVVGQQINLGQFVASEIVILIVIQSVEKLISTMETIYDVLTSLEKLGNVTDLPIEDEEGLDFAQIDTGKGVAIELKGVGYTYPNGHRPTLVDIQISVAEGEKVCIAGYNGSGKSTLINVLASMLHQYTGVISYNGMSMKNLNLLSMRSYVGESLSNRAILNGTIEENISMGREDISFQDITRAADCVGLSGFIDQMPEGYNTVIVPEDLTIPSTVLNKITLARSIAENPRLFVMDEVFRGLEIRDKERIVDFFCGESSPWTVVAASNDRVFASRCSRIYVMNNGRIVDSGTYEEIRQRPYFDNIFNN